MDEVESGTGDYGPFFIGHILFYEDIKKKNLIN